MKFGSQSEVNPIHSLLLKHPRDAFQNQKYVDECWKKLNYTSAPDFEASLIEYDRFVEILNVSIPEIYYLPYNQNTTMDSVYVHDAALVTRHGAILCNMGKSQRNAEPRAMADCLKDLDVPILGAIEGEGRLEGGDVVWFDDKTVAVAHGYRTNGEGIRQLRELTADFVEEVVIVPLPHWNGPDDVLHLMSFISPISHDLALVYSRLMPVPFRQWLLGRGMRLIEVPDDEYTTMACNVLAVAPGKCIMLEGNPVTKNCLEEAGVEVIVYPGAEISHKGAGGPTCLTRPLLRI